MQPTVSSRSGTFENTWIFSNLTDLTFGWDPLTLHEVFSSTGTRFRHAGMAPQNQPDEPTIPPPDSPLCCWKKSLPPSTAGSRTRQKPLAGQPAGGK